MPTSYVSTSPSLEFRKPVQPFAIAGWIAAGMLNPAGWFSYLVWGMPEFNYTIWAWHVAVPLELGLLFAMLYIRDGGLGIRGVTGITLICIFAACTGTAPFYTLITWAGQQVGVSVSAMGLFEVYSWEAAIAHTGTYVRASLYFAGVAAIPAVIILRVIALQPTPRRGASMASPSTPPQAPAA
ncbi:MAG: hypothetical protein ABMA14_03935 [Hyphomonadaceae bacterium]